MTPSALVPVWLRVQASRGASGAPSALVPVARFFIAARYPHGHHGDQGRARLRRAHSSSQQAPSPRVLRPSKATIGLFISLSPRPSGAAPVLRSGSRPLGSEASAAYQRAPPVLGAELAEDLLALPGGACPSGARGGDGESRPSPLECCARLAVWGGGGKSRVISPPPWGPIAGAIRVLQS